LTAWELSGYATVSVPLYDDGDGAALDAYLFAVFAEAVSWFEDFAFFQGTGAGQPTGILNAGAALSVSRATANLIQYADVSGMLAKLLPSSLNHAFYAFSPTALPQLLQLRDRANRAAFLAVGDAQPPGTPRRWLLANLPAYCTEKLPALGTKGDLVLIDPRFYVIGEHTVDGSTLQLAASGDVNFLKNQVTIRIVKRVDGQPWLDKPITLQDGFTQVSPFVILN
jgi:HK97 family phage major capsid protein